MAKFREIWTNFEKEKIKADIKLRVDSNAADKEWLGEHADSKLEEETKAVDALMEEIENVEDDDHRKLLTN